MPIVELYSRRRKRELGIVGDTLQYDSMPTHLRQQCLYVVQDFFGKFNDQRGDGAYRAITNALRREFGVNSLTNRHHEFSGREFEHFVQKVADDEQSLDAIELAIRFIYIVSKNPSTTSARVRECKDALEEFNERCKQAGFGYAFENGSLIRIDSKLLHAEAVKPALVFLSDPVFRNADQEFRSAHDHWKHGKSAEVFVDCLKAFESTMKIIAVERKWAIPDKPTASQLVQVMLDNSLVPAYYQAQMAGLRSTLESGIPTPRNRVGGHGAGAGAAPDIPTTLVRYVLHLTAATVLFLVETHNSMP